MSEETGHEASTAGINPLDGESVLKNVHPSWINWKKRLFFAFFFVVIGAMIKGSVGAFFIVFGLFLVFTVFFSRRASRYIVTNQRVKVKVGHLGSTTHEARLDKLNGIATKSGFIEGLFGKGTVSVTDAAREEMYIKGVGNYQDLARTLREQQRQASQPGRAGRQPRSVQQQQAGGRQQAQPQGEQSQGQQQAESASEPTASDSVEAEETSRERCLNCSSSIDDSVDFCPECGTQEPFTLSSGSTSEDGEAGATADGESNSSSSDLRDRPVVDAADAIASRNPPDDDAARELCRALADPDADRHEVKSALRAAVGAIEESEADVGAETERSVPDALAGLGESPTANQLESARSRLSRSDHPAATAALPVVDRTIQLEAERERAATERDRYRETIESICDAAARSGAVSFTGSDPGERGEELVATIERGDAVIDSPGTPWESVAAEIERSHRPQTSEARDLLDTFETTDSEEITASLGAAVEGLEELGKLRSGIADIGERDIRRRIDSLEEELGRADGSVYRHLADRVRELEAMIEEGVDDVQLYAIYQECTFYDRTLVPRLSRSDNSSESVDIARRVRDVEDRIEVVNDEYVSVRPDHNHTIPKHFLDLADTLRDQAQQTGHEQPQQAAGQLAAASDLLDHVEELYERNEYSVMLRRLRG